MIKNIKTFFGRRQGRPLSAAKKEALDALLSQCAIPDGQITEDGTFDPGSGPVTLEIGFGYGEHLAELMRQNPDRTYIGVEPFINGMAAFASSLLCHPRESGDPADTKEEDSCLRRNDTFSNLHVYMDDAVPLVKSLSDHSVDEIYILNPDPWHKTRHHKRRIVRPETIADYARILKPGGRLITSTDVPYLAEWMVMHTVNHPAFTWTAQSRADWETPPKDWIHTRYETKGAKGSAKMRYFIFEHIPTP